MSRMPDNFENETRNRPLVSIVSMFTSCIMIIPLNGNPDPSEERPGRLV